MRKPDLIHGFVLFVLLIMVSGCATQQSPYMKAKRADSIYAYESFLRQHPDSEMAPQAKQRLLELNWQRAQRENTLRSYESFIKNYPNSPFDSEARAKLLDLSYLNTKNEDTLDAYRAFLRKYPDCTYAPETRNKITAIEKADREFERTEKTIPRLEDFMEKFPEGPTFRKARLKTESIMVGQIKKSGAAGRFTISDIKPNENGYVSRWTISEVPGKPELYALEFEGPFILENTPSPDPPGTPAWARFPFAFGKMQFSGSTPEGKVNKAFASTRRKPGMNPIFPSGPETIFRFKGKVKYGGHTFQGQENNPLTFVLLKDIGFVHLRGQGQIILKDGKTRDLNR